MEKPHIDSLDDFLLGLLIRLQALRDAKTNEARDGCMYEARKFVIKNTVDNSPLIEQIEKIAGAVQGIRNDPWWQPIGLDVIESRCRAALNNYSQGNITAKEVRKFRPMLYHSIKATKSWLRNQMRRLQYLKKSKQ